jgi:hypothetical protein
MGSVGKTMKLYLVYRRMVGGMEITSHTCAQDYVLGVSFHVKVHNTFAKKKSKRT